VTDPLCRVRVDWQCSFDDSVDLFIAKIVCYAVLTQTTDHGSIMSLTCTLPWRRHTNLDNYTILLLLAAMVHSKAMV
jgi:hypothetical protein